MVYIGSPPPNHMICVCTVRAMSGLTSVAGPSVEQVQSSHQQGVLAVQCDGSS